MSELPDNVRGFRRRILLLPGDGNVRAELEDDYHRMSVALFHGATHVERAEAVMHRAPWTTCTGAIPKLGATFDGRALADVRASGMKFSNCTHLYDLAILAAAHAHERDPIAFDVVATDSVDGESRAILWRNGERLFCWTLQKGVILTPAELAGRHLTELGDWITTLDPVRAEAARILRWATMMSRGRRITIPDRAASSRLRSGVCHTFQPDVAQSAMHVAESVRAFDGDIVPLAEFEACFPIPTGAAERMQ